MRPDTILAMSGINKLFVELRALFDVGLNLRANEILVISGLGSEARTWTIGLDTDFSAALCSVGSVRMPQDSSCSKRRRTAASLCLPVAPPKIHGQ